MRSKFLVLSLALVLMAGVSALRAEGSLAVQGGYIFSVFDKDQNKLHPGKGINAYLSADVHLLSWMTAGIGAGLTSLSEDGVKVKIDGVGLMGRICPWDKKSFAPYLIGGVAYRPLAADEGNDWDPDWLIGHYQGLAGVGVRQEITKKILFDVTGFYNYQSPKDSPIHVLGARAGLAFRLGGGAKGSEESAKKTEIKQAEVVAEATKAPETTEASSNIPAPGEAEAAKTPETTVAEAIPTPVEEETVKAEVKKEVAKAEEPVKAEVPAPVAETEASTYTYTGKDRLGLGNGPKTTTGLDAICGWWGVTFEKDAAFKVLKEERVPKYVKAKDLTTLGQEGQCFFNELQKTKITRPEFLDYRAGYYTAVARELSLNNQPKEAAFYLGMILRDRPGFQEAVDLKAKLGL